MNESAEAVSTDTRLAGANLAQHGMGLHDRLAHKDERKKSVGIKTHVACQGSKGS